MPNKLTKRPGAIIVGCVCFVIVGVVISRYWTTAFPYIISVPEKSMPVGIGDQFNVLTAIFTLLAFVGLFGALLLQRQDLELQREDLDMQRSEAADQQRYLDDQRKQAAKDQVRREVFQLMDAWQELVHHTAYKVDTEGRAAFPIMSANLRSKLEATRGGQPLSKPKLEHVYEDFYQGKYKDALGNYFRLLYHILRYIDRSKAVLDWHERKQLTRLIRAHLSEPEFHLLFWNGLTKHGAKMFPLIAEYDMLQNYSFDIRDVRDEEVTLYPRTHQRLLERCRRDTDAGAAA